MPKSSQLRSEHDYSRIRYRHSRSNIATLWSHIKEKKFFTQSFAAALVRPELVALDAPALEPPLRVGTALAAVTFFSTLVHIWKSPGAEVERKRNQRC